MNYTLTAVSRLLVALALSAGVAKADVMYTMTPAPCTAALFPGTGDIPFLGDRIPCGSITGTLSIDDEYVPGSFANWDGNGIGLDFWMFFSVRNPSGLEIDHFVFSPGAQRLHQGFGYISMPVTSGVAHIDLGSPATDLRDSGGYLRLIGTIHAPYRYAEYTAASFWTRENAMLRVSAISEPHPAALLGFALAALAVARRRR